MFITLFTHRPRVIRDRISLSVPDLLISALPTDLGRGLVEAFHLVFKTPRSAAKSMLGLTEQTLKHWLEKLVKSVVGATLAACAEGKPERLTNVSPTSPTNTHTLHNTTDSLMIMRVSALFKQSVQKHQLFIDHRLFWIRSFISLTPPSCQHPSVSTVYPAEQSAPGSPIRPTPLSFEQ